ncbi:MAG: hypothetical protein FWC85_02825, partial [Elusimicrobia bacterium]|nr:hypothetical protein [Elusimicrobiota bacterium]
MPIKPITRLPKRHTVTLSAPTAGWSAAETPENMPINTAIEMENWLPKENCLQLRSGYRKVLDSPRARTIFAYSVAGNEQLLFASGSKIFKADLANSATQAIKENCLSDIWHYTLYRNRIFAVNGEDMPLVYDGQNIEEARFTGDRLSPRNLSAVEIYQNRLFFIEKNTLTFW